MLLSSSLVAFNGPPLLSAGTTYRADFTEAAGLHAGDLVTIAGSRRAASPTVELDGDHVLRHVRRRRRVGRRPPRAVDRDPHPARREVPRARPAGRARRSTRTRPIPLARTASPFDVVEPRSTDCPAPSTSSTPQQLATSLTTLADTFRDTPGGGPRRARRAVPALHHDREPRRRDPQAARPAPRQLSGVLADRNDDVAKLLSDGNLLLAELQRRKDAIARLLDRHPRACRSQLRGLVADNPAQLRPTLETLDRVVDVLQRNQDDLAATIKNEAVFVRAVRQHRRQRPLVRQLHLRPARRRPSARSTRADADARSWASDRRGAALTALVVLASSSPPACWPRTARRAGTITAYFTDASALFPDNQVRVLGVPVGTIDAITPEGTQVRVDMTIDRPGRAAARRREGRGRLAEPRHRPLRPADADLTGGPRAGRRRGDPARPHRRAARRRRPRPHRHRARPGRSARTGANRTGALSDALNVGAPNLDGNGQALNDTIAQPRRAVGHPGRVERRTCSARSPSCRPSPSRSRAQRRPGPRVQRPACADVTGFLAGAARRARRRAGRAVTGARRRGGVRPGQPGRAAARRGRAGRRHRHAGRPAAGAHRGARRRPGGAEQPRQHLQRLVGHPRHPARHQRAGQPAAGHAVQAARRQDLRGRARPRSPTRAESLSSVVSGAVPLPSATDVAHRPYANQPPPVAGLALPTVAAPAAAVVDRPTRAAPVLAPARSSGAGTGGARARAAPALEPDLRRAADACSAVARDRPADPPAALCSSVGLTSGCGVLSGGLRGVDLPGGADLGDDPYAVTIEFADVVDLVPQSLVKVDDVPVGTVSDIAVDPRLERAGHASMVNHDVALPANAHRPGAHHEPARGEVRRARARPRRGATGALGRRRRRDPARPLRAGRRGGGGARVAVDAAQRRRRRADPDDLHRAEQRPRRATSRRCGRCWPTSNHARRRAGRPQDRDHPRARRDQPALGHPGRAPRRDRARRSTTSSPGLRRARAASAGSWWTCCGRSTGCPGSRRTSSTAAATTCSPTCAAAARPWRSSPSPARTCRTRCRSSAASRSPTPRTDAVAGDYANLYVTGDLDLERPARQPRAVQPAVPRAGHAAVQHAAAHRAGARPADRRRRRPAAAVPGARRGAACRCRCPAPAPATPGRGSPAPDAGTRAVRRAVRRPARRWLVITRMVRVQLLALLLVAVVGVGYVGFRYAGLRRRLGATTVPVTVQLADSGGIFTGADVTYRGVSVGRVGPLTLTAAGVDVQLDIDTRRPAIPADVDARCATCPRSASSTSTCGPRPTAARCWRAARRSRLARTTTPVGGRGPRRATSTTSCARCRSTRLRTVVDRAGHRLRRHRPAAAAAPGHDRRSSRRPRRTRCRRPWPCCATGAPCSPRRTRPRASSPTSAAASRQLADQLKTSDPDLRRLIADRPAGRPTRSAALLGRAAPGSATSSRTC